MKRIKNLGVMALVAMLLMSTLLLTACGGQKQEAAGETQAAAAKGNEVTYKVSVLDATGKPYSSGVIVRFLKDGQQASMQVVDENGTVTKNLEKGTYTVELMFTESDVEYAYDQSNLTLTPEAPELSISLAYSVAGETMEMYFGDKVLNAYFVDACCTQVPLTPGERSYFVFVPKEAGTYEISAIGEVDAIGLYGTPYYISDMSIEPVVDGKVTTSIRADMIGSGEGGSTMLVIGIDSQADSCVLSVDRVGDPAWSPEDVPYEIYQTTGKLEPYTLPAGAKLVDFDLTASTDTYNLVMDADGFYHLDSEDGPLVLVLLGKDNKYMSCFKEVLTKTGVRKYFYDENGEFIKRESYDECLREYFEYMDEDDGVYPLTEDLKYIIQQRGDHGNWFKLDSNESLFRDDNGMPLPGINAEIAWLFMCVYIAQ